MASDCLSRYMNATLQQLFMVPTFRDGPDCFPHLMALLIAALIRCPPSATDSSLIASLI